MNTVAMFHQPLMIAMILGFTFLVSGALWNR